MANRTFADAVGTLKSFFSIGGVHAVKEDRQIVGGSGIAGGGDLSANRTLTLDQSVISVPHTQISDWSSAVSAVSITHSQISDWAAATAGFGGGGGGPDNAAALPFTPAGGIASSNTQAAVEEALSNAEAFTGTALANHSNVAGDEHRDRYYTDVSLMALRRGAGRCQVRQCYVGPVLADTPLNFSLDGVTDAWTTLDGPTYVVIQAMASAPLTVGVEIICPTIYWKDGIGPGTDFPLYGGFEAYPSSTHFEVIRQYTAPAWPDFYQRLEVPLMRSAIEPIGAGEQIQIRHQGGTGGLKTVTFMIWVFSYAKDDDLSCDNTVFGVNAGRSFTPSVGGVANAIFGSGAGALLDSDSNTIVGAYAMRAATNAGQNVAVGFLALDVLISGGFNTVVGSHAGHEIVTGHGNIFLGVNSGEGLGDVSNTFSIGCNSAPINHLTINYDAGFTGGPIMTNKIEFGDDVKISSGKTLQLGNAFQAGAPTCTGYITVKDSTGTVYKVLVAP